jgi:hypothetical protein
MQRQLVFIRLARRLTGNVSRFNRLLPSLAIPPMCLGKRRTAFRLERAFRIEPPE